MTTDFSIEIDPNAYIFTHDAEERARRATQYLVGAASDYVKSVRDNAKTFETDARFAIAVTAVAETTDLAGVDYDKRLTSIGGAALSLAHAEIFDEAAVPGSIAPKASDIKRITLLGYSRIKNQKGKFIPRANPNSALDVLDCLYREQLEFQQNL